MEQKKTLWIIAAVGVFLLVVLGAALILYSPSAKRAPAVTSVTPVEKPNTNYSNSNGWTNPEPQKQVSPDFQRPETTIQAPTQNVNDMFVVAENATVLDMGQNQAAAQSTTIDLNTLKREMAAENVNQPQNINITVNIPEPEKTEKVISIQTPVYIESDYYTGKAKEAEKTEKSTAVKVTQVTETAKTVEKPAVSTAKPATPKVEAKPTATASKTVTTNTTKVTATVNTTKPVTRYWVQVAAYGSKKAAEGARAILNEKKIASDIYTYQDNKDNLFYRVRVGPYTTKSEAEYWKAKIVEISDFAKAGSYVTSTVD